MRERGERAGRGGAAGQRGAGQAGPVLAGQPAPEHGDAQPVRAGHPGPGGVLQQGADIPEVGPDGVRRGVPLGRQVPPETVQRPAQRLGQLARRVLRWLSHPPSVAPAGGYSTVTLLARLRGLSTSFPSATAAW